RSPDLVRRARGCGAPLGLQRIYAVENELLAQRVAPLARLRERDVFGRTKAHMVGLAVAHVAKHPSACFPRGGDLQVDAVSDRVASGLGERVDLARRR